jgi:hypothetical protein
LAAHSLSRVQLSPCKPNHTVIRTLALTAPGRESSFDTPVQHS